MEKPTIPILAATLAIGLVLGATPTVQAADSDYEGTVVARHSDDFNGKSSHVTYLLDQANGPTLRLAGTESQLASLQPGEQIEVSGDLRGETVHLGEGDPDPGDGSSARGVAAAPAPQKVAVILLNFTNDRSQPWTPSEIQDTVFTDPDSVNAYFQEESTDQIELTGKNSVNGDVLGWYEIADSNTGCNYTSWASAAQAAAASNGDNLSGYDNFLYIWPDAPSCNWAGLAYLPGSSAFINGAPSLRVISHELSHNFGIHHASSYRCTTGGQRVFISSSCTQSEYGDPFSVMGGSSSNHANAWHKVQLGFLPSSSIRTVTTSGDYSVSPSEQLLSGQTQQLRIPRKFNTNGSVSDYYYVDFRQPFGTYFDAFSSSSPAVTGVTVRVAGPTSALTQSKLLDATPATNSFSDAPLPVGQSATDSSTGLTIKTLSVAPSGADVQISYATPAASEPSTPDATTPGSAIPAAAPRLSYLAGANKRVLKTRQLVVSAGCDVSCSLTASGAVKFAKRQAKLRTARGVAKSKSLVRLKLALSNSALKVVRKAFRAKKKAKVRVKLVATGESGESTSTSKRVTLRP